MTAGNLCKNFYGQKERLKETFLTEEEKVCLADERGRDVAEETVRRNSIHEALKQLSDEQREAVLLYYFQELKIREIAAILGQTSSNIEYRLRAAKNRLKEILGKEEPT